MQTTSLPLALATVFLAAAPSVAAKFVVDAAHSRIAFSVPFMRVILGSVEGEFTRFVGEVEYDPADLTASAVSIVIDATSVSTALDARDLDLRSESYFDAESHPEITFRSGRVEMRPEGPVLLGNLALKGVSRDVRIPFRLVDLGDTLVASGETQLDRHEFGIAQNPLTGDFVIGDQVEVRLQLVLERARQEQPD